MSKPKIYVYKKVDASEMPPKGVKRSHSRSENEMIDVDVPRMAAKPCMTEAFKDDVRPLIDLIDKLREYGLDKDVPLPSIVVVGDQSSGKSSVLEALSGVQLPRGIGWNFDALVN